MKTHICILLLLSSIAVSAQEMSDTLRAESKFKEGLELKLKAKFKEAIDVMEIAAQIYEELQLWNSYLPVAVSIGKTKADLGQFNEAQEKAEEIVEQAQKYLGGISLIEADAYDLIGYVNFRFAHVETATSYYQQALDIRLELLEEDEIILAATYHTWV